MNGEQTPGFSGVFFQFGSEHGDVVVYSSRRRVVFKTPYKIQNLVACNHAARISGKQSENSKLLGSHFECRCALQRDVAPEIHNNVVEPHLVWESFGTSPPSKQSTNARQDFPNMEWLRNVVVCSDVESHDTISLLTARR